MKSIVVYDSSYGNTRIIAETISGTLNESGIEAEAFYVKDVKRLNAKDYDLLVLGSPTRLGTMSLTVRGFLGRVKNEWAGKPFAAFDTEMQDNIDQNQGNAAEKIAGKLREKQMNQLLPVLKAVVSGMKGPLKEGEIERAKDYAGQVATRLKAEKSNRF